MITTDKDLYILRYFNNILKNTYDLDLNYHQMILN